MLIFLDLNSHLPTSTLGLWPRWDEKEWTLQKGCVAHCFCGSFMPDPSAAANSERCSKFLPPVAVQFRLEGACHPS